MVKTRSQTKKKGKPKGRPAKVPEPLALKSARVKSTKVLSTADTSPVKKRTRNSNTSPSEILFTFKEKQAFFDCLNENGFHVIYDLDKLAEVLPDRSANEIQYLIDNYKKKSRDRKREEQKNVTNSIESWFNILNKVVNSSLKKEKLSELYVDVFHHFAKVHSSKSLSQNEQVDYGKLYYYISEALSGRCPPDLELNEAVIMIKLMEDLNEMIMKDNNFREKVFLKQANWWKVKSENESNILNGHSTNGNQSASSSQTEIDSQAMDSNSQASESDSQATQTDSQVTQTDSQVTIIDPIDAEVEPNLNLPKIRKISECLNPLNISNELLKEELHRWQAPISIS